MPLSTLRRLKAEMARLIRREDGSVAVEAVIILPVLVLFFLTSFTFYDAYRKSTVITKAGYTLSDILSRQDGVVNAAYVEGLSDVFSFIVRGRERTFIRVTRVMRRVDTDAGIDEYIVVPGQSYATDGNPPMDAASLDANLARIPTLGENASVTVLETYTPYVPPFFIGLDSFTMESFVVTPQRSGLPIQLNFSDAPNFQVAANGS